MKSSMPSRRTIDGPRTSFARSARSCAGTISPPCTAVHLDDVAEDVIDIARADIIGRGVSLSTRFERGLAPISGDRVQLQQVLFEPRDPTRAMP